MSIEIYYGDDRVKAEAEIRRALGGDYEVVDGEEVSPEMLATIFMGVSLFAENRKIVIKDLSLSSAAWEKVSEYAETEHQVILWESKLDKRSVGYKALKNVGLVMREFKMPEKVAPGKVFDIYNTALRDGAKAVKLLEEIQLQEDPYKMMGLFTTQATRGFDGSARQKKIVKELARVDLQMKSTAVEPWQLVKSFLVRLSSL